MARAYYSHYCIALTTRPVLYIHFSDYTQVKIIIFMIVPLPYIFPPDIRNHVLFSKLSALT